MGDVSGGQRGSGTTGRDRVKLHPRRPSKSGCRMSSLAGGASGAHLPVRAPDQSWSGGTETDASIPRLGPLGGLSTQSLSARAGRGIPAATREGVTN